MVPFRTHDLLADFGELRHRLLLMLGDGAALSKVALVDAFLLAAGLNQVLEDYMSEGAPLLTAAARVVGKSALGPLRALEWPLSAGARMFQRHRDGGHLRECQRELAAVVDAFADDVARSRADSGWVPATPADRVARCIEQLGRLSTDVQSRVIRLPACFRSLDQDPEDFGRLIDRFSAEHPDRARPVLVVGLRSSGSYTAPLCAAFLRASHYPRVETITVRPRQHWLPGELERIAEAARSSATVLVSDDPPNSGGSLLAVAKELEGLGVRGDRIVIAVPLMGDDFPHTLAAYDRAVLPAGKWAIQDRLAEGAVRESLTQLLAGKTIEAAGAKVRVAGVGCVARLSLPPMTDLKSGSPSRRHTRALFNAELVDDAGRVHQHAVYVKGTGLGYMGDHSVAIGSPLQEFFPAVYGVQGGLMFRAWMPDAWSLGGGAGPVPRDLTRRIAAYVLARREALGTDRDIAERLAGEGPLWKQTSQVLLSLFGKLRLGALAITDRASKRILHADPPSVIDGSMGRAQWFAEPGAGARGIRKVDFDERAFSNQDFIIDQLYCYDAVYDLASAAADHDGQAAERGEASGFVDSLKREYELASGSRVSEERWLLYQLMHTITHQRFMSDLPNPEQGGDRRNMVLKFIAGQRAMSRAAQRYYRARFFRGLVVPPHGPLCAIDIDGVLETDALGFPATTPAGAMALRALSAHGYRPVLVSGRSLDEIRERCRAYSLAGGVAEYGAAIYKHDGNRIIHLTTADARDRLKALRALVARDHWVHVDSAYQGVLRAYRFDRHGRRRHLEPATLLTLAPELARLRLRQVDGAYQTDFVPEEVDKGTAIRRLQEELGAGVPAPVVLAVGDGAEDLAAFKVAARSFAPANAHEDVRAASRGVPNLKLLRQRAQAGLALAAASVIGHRPGRCPTCAPPTLDRDARLLMTMLSTQDGQKLHKLRMALSAALQLAHPGSAANGKEVDNTFLAIGQAAGRRIVKGEGLVGSSGLVFSGNLIARGIGLLFVVAAARFLTATNLGLLAYALVIVNFGTVLITNAPAGLSGFLARNAGNRAEQDKYFTNWVVGVTAMLAVSLVAIVPIGLVAGLNGWMIPALMANLLGIAIFETYRTSQRGLARFRSMTSFYILANLMQLVAILLVGFAGFRDAALFVTIYGLTNVAALLVMELIAPTPLRFAFSSLQGDLVRRIALLSWPLLLQTAFFAAWFGADLIFVRAFLEAPLAGDYVAAKTLVNLVALPAGAIGSAVVPRIAGLSGPPFRRDVGRALALAAAAVLPSLLVLIVLGGPIVRMIFGSRYPHTVEPLPLLAVGMSAYAFYVVLESVWVGLGRPAIDAVATGAGMLATVSVGLLAVPRAGLQGAAAAFAIGAGVQLAVILSFTVVTYVRASHAGRPLGRAASLEATPVMNSGAA